MPKVVSNNIKGLFIKFTLKSLISSAVSIVGLCAITAFAFVKLDIDLKYCFYTSFVIIVPAAFISSYTSIGEIRNNIFIFSILSQLPLMIFIIVNGLINKEKLLYLLIKIILIVIISLLSAILKARKK